MRETANRSVKLRRDWRLTTGQFLVVTALEVTWATALLFAPLTFSPGFTLILPTMGLLIFTVLSGDLRTVPRILRERFGRRVKPKKEAKA